MNLLIFIDGLSFKNSKKISFLSEFRTKKIIPGIGFSNNIYAEIVTGKTPDKIGYFNEWTLKNSLNNQSPLLLSFLDIFREVKFINLGIRMLCKKLGFNFFNIPFSYFFNFKSNGPHYFDFFDSPNLVKDFNFSISDSSKINKSVGKRDLIAINTLYKFNSKNIFLSLVDLDNISHIYGVNSKEYNSHLKLLNTEILKFIKFLKTTKSKEPLNIFVFSDHGMSNVKKIINFNVEDYFDKPSDFTYHYFIDSTFIRFWIFDKFHYDLISKKLKKLKFGKIIGKRERAVFEVTKKEFGDVIFRLNEGNMFAPNFFGVRPCKSMHGYSSFLENQAAFIATNSKIKFNNLKYSRDIYSFLKKKLTK